MDSFSTMLRLQTMLLVFMLVGVYVKKRNIVTKEAQPYFTEFLIQVALPCMIFHSFKGDWGPETLRMASKALTVSSLVCIFSFLLGFVLYRKEPPERRSVMRYGTVLSNAGFAGLPQAQGAYGAAGLMYASIFIIPMRIFMWLGGISLFIQTDTRTKIKKVLTNPGILAVFAGVARMLLRVPLPEAVDSAIKAIGDCTNPLSMIVIGMVVADIPLRAVLDKGVVWLSAVRLLIVPVCVLLALKALHVDPMITGISVILIAMPVGVNTPILAQKYGADYEFASKSVLLSTVLSIVTLPIICLFI